MSEKEIIKKTVKAIECSMALDMPHRYGIIVLEENGFDYENRFEHPATEFVKQLQKEAIDAAKEYL